ncbi:MAG TPA: MarR family transcriptional regulator [Steroidobacteraceae bacterium]|jgi:DNA-binding MarR family transcriptional regulator|nr:MarR family transcriptional regulator [Steroidobacteraceae bacterium]
MATTTGGERGEAAAVRVRSRSRRPSPARVERAAGAKVDLACLPRLLGFNLRRAHQCAWRQYVAVIGDKDIRPGLFSLLVLVGANPGIAQIELGTHLGIDKASIVALLDRLEKAALLDRLRSTRDRRRQGIYLTPLGSEALESLVAAVRTLERRMASRFTRSEFDLLLSFLRRLHA